MHSCVESYFPQDKSSHELPMLPKQKKRLVGAPFGQYNKMPIQIGQKTFLDRSESQGKKRPQFSDQGGWGAGHFVDY